MKQPIRVDVVIGILAWLGLVLLMVLLVWTVRGDELATFFKGEATKVVFISRGQWNGNEVVVPMGHVRIALKPEGERQTLPFVRGEGIECSVHHEMVKVDFPETGEKGIYPKMLLDCGKNGKFILAGIGFNEP